MIIYEKGGIDGPGKLFRIHGSAVYKGIIPTCLSTGVLLIYEYVQFDGLVPTALRFVSGNDKFVPRYTIIQHPYTIGAFIGFFRYVRSYFLSEPPERTPVGF
jgi:hypothetical protein